MFNMPGQFGQMGLPNQQGYQNHINLQQNFPQPGFLKAQSGSMIPGIFPGIQRNIKNITRIKLIFREYQCTK